MVDLPLATQPLLGFAEPLASWLHLGGAAAALAMGGRLSAGGTTPGARVALRMFAVSAAIALVLSGVYHAVAPGESREVLRRLDHAGIWLLIAATFTPVHVVLFSGAWRWAPLAVIWTAAIAGIALKTIFFHGLPDSLGLVLYLALGWLGAGSALMIARRHGWPAIRLLMRGGLVYSIGGVVSIVGHPKLLPGFIGHHELFHAAVLLALLAHWRFMEQLSALTAGAPLAEPVAALAA